MNELTEFGGWSEAIGRRYGAPGPAAALVRTVATDLFPTVSVDSAHADPELLYLAGEMLAAGSAFDAAPAPPARGQVGIANPDASQVIVVVDQIVVLNWVADIRRYDLRIKTNGTLPDTDDRSQGIPRDSRWRGSSGGRSTAYLFSRSSQDVTAAGLYIDTISLPAGLSGSFLAPPIVLDPGSQLTCYGQTAGEIMHAIFRWRERRLTTWERGP